MNHWLAQVASLAAWTGSIGVAGGPGKITPVVRKAAPILPLKREELRLVEVDRRHDVRVVGERQQRQLGRIGPEHGVDDQQAPRVGRAYRLYRGEHDVLLRR